MGGGSFELHCAQVLGIKVVAYDSFEPLVNFWNVLKKHPQGLMKQCVEYIPTTATHHKLLLEGMFDGRASDTLRAACFYNTIRTSYGSVIYETFVPDKVKTLKASIPRLCSVDLGNISIKHATFERSIPRCGDKWMYLDPPYHVHSRLYASSDGTRWTRPSQINKFDHVLLCDMLKRHPSWMMSYNDDAYIRELYRGHHIVKLNWKYKANQSKSSSEIVIFSDGKYHR